MVHGLKCKMYNITYLPFAISEFVQSFIPLSLSDSFSLSDSSDDEKISLTRFLFLCLSSTTFFLLLVSVSFLFISRCVDSVSFLLLVAVLIFSERCSVS